MEFMRSIQQQQFSAHHWGCCFIRSVHWPFVLHFGTQGATLRTTLYAKSFPPTVCPFLRNAFNIEDNARPVEGLAAALTACPDDGARPVSSQRRPSQARQWVACGRLTSVHAGQAQHSSSCARTAASLSAAAPSASTRARLLAGLSSTASGAGLCTAGGAALGGSAPGGVLSGGSTTTTPEVAPARPGRSPVVHSSYISDPRAPGSKR